MINNSVSVVRECKDVLYKVELSGVTDYEECSDATKLRTFTGQAPVLQSALLSAYCQEPETVLLKFNVDIDPASLANANFTATEAYGVKQTLLINKIRCAKVGDYDEAGTILTREAAKKYIILEISGMKNANL